MARDAGFSRGRLYIWMICNARSEYLYCCQSPEKAGKKQSAKAEWKRQRHQLYTIINKRYAAQPIGKIQSAVFS